MPMVIGKRGPKRHRVRGRKLNRRQKREVKRLVGGNTELKYQLTASTGSMSTTGAITKVSTIAQGDTDQTRDGDRLKYRSFKFICTINKHTSNTTDTLEYARFIIFQWHPSDALKTPVLTDILRPDPSLAAVGPRSHYNHDTRQMYKILYDKMVPMVGLVANSANPETTTNMKLFRSRIKKKFSHQVQFDAGNSTGTNQIFIASIGSTATNPMQVNVSFWIYFTDG